MLGGRLERYHLGHRGRARQADDDRWCECRSRGSCNSPDWNRRRSGVGAYIKVSNDNTKIVPGHGALAKKADLVAWRAMLVTSHERIEKLFNESKTEQEVLAAKPLADLDAKWAANEQQAQNWTRMVYNSFKRS
jgi:hypothetical protein